MSQSRKPTRSTSLTYRQARIAVEMQREHEAGLHEQRKRRSCPDCASGFEGEHKDQQMTAWDEKRKPLYISNSQYGDAIGILAREGIEVFGGPSEDDALKP